MEENFDGRTVRVLYCSMIAATTVLYSGCDSPYGMLFIARDVLRC